MTIKLYGQVRVVRICDDRFSRAEPVFERHPRVGDVGYVIEIYAKPVGYEVECCARDDGITTWLEPMSPDEIVAAE